MDRSKEPPKAGNRVVSAGLFRAHICGALAGGTVFLIILVTYFAGLFVQRASVGLISGYLFKTFSIAGGKVYGTRSTMENIYSWYDAPESSEWADYEYSGRMMLTDERGGIGVIFLARRRGEKDCFYSLRRCGEGDTFFLGGHRLEIEGKGETDTEVSPEARTWYRLRIRAENEGDRTRIRAKVWSERNAEPAKWQVDCFDAGAFRNARGFVGVWGCSQGEKYFDDLIVRQILGESRRGASHKSVLAEGMPDSAGGEGAGAASQSNELAASYLLREDFDGFRIGEHPAAWKDGIAPVDLSEAADRLSRFFRMNLLDFAGPWDEIVDFTAVALTFCLAGLLAGIALGYRSSVQPSGTQTRRRRRIPFEFLPFVALSVYVGAMKGVGVVLYATAGVGAGHLWRFLQGTLVRLLARAAEGEPGERS